LLPVILSKLTVVIVQEKCIFCQLIQLTAVTYAPRQQQIDMKSGTSSKVLHCAP